MKKAFNIIIILTLGMLLTGCTKKSTIESKDCFSSGKQMDGNTLLVAALVEGANSTATEQTKFTIEELEDIRFGMTGENKEELYYGTYELCDLETGEYLVEGDYSKELWNAFVKEDNGSLSSFGGNHSSFIYSIEDVEFNYITEPGEYSVNTFSASEDGDWELADTLEFTVTD